LQLTRRGERLLKHGKLLSNAGPDFRRPADPLATGPAIAVTARLKAPTLIATMKIAVIQGEMPRRLAALTNGASVSATTPAENTGSRIVRPR